MPKGVLPPALRRANEIRKLKARGHSESEAIAMVDKKRGGGGSGTAHGETVVPTSGGAGIRQRGRGLYAAVEAHTVIEYDQLAIAAVWQGLVGALRTGGAIDASILFPDECDDTPLPEKRYAQERAMGAEMAAMIGIALKALKVTTDEWALWYAKSATVRIRHSVNCNCGCNNQQGHAPQLTGGSEVGGWGSPFGPPAFSGGSSGGGG